MSGEIIKEADFLIVGSKPLITSTINVECIINLLFTHTELYTYAGALTVLGTLCMADLITKPLYTELKKAVKAVY